MFTFESGSRTCIGRNFAMATMSKVVPEFLRQFEIELADPKGEDRFEGPIHYFMWEYSFGHGTVFISRGGANPIP